MRTRILLLLLLCANLVFAYSFDESSGSNYTKNLFNNGVMMSPQFTQSGGGRVTIFHVGAVAPPTISTRAVSRPMRANDRDDDDDDFGTGSGGDFILVKNGKTNSRR